MFEVFGHYQQHPLHKDAKLEGSVRQPPRRMLPPSIPISQPVRSSKFGALPSPCTAHIHAKVKVPHDNYSDLNALNFRLTCWFGSKSAS